jgi:hypothetical protein
VAITSPSGLFQEQEIEFHPRFGETAMPATKWNLLCPSSSLRCSIRKRDPLLATVSYLTTNHSADGRGSNANADGDANGLDGLRSEL